MDNACKCPGRRVTDVHHRCQCPTMLLYLVAFALTMLSPLSLSYRFTAGCNCPLFLFLGKVPFTALLDDNALVLLLQEETDLLQEQRLCRVVPDAAGSLLLPVHSDVDLPANSCPTAQCNYPDVFLPANSCSPAHCSGP